MPKKQTRAKKPVKDFQSIIASLQQFWMDWGCVLWQPHSEKVGAGTMNPATFLRVLGPEPWNVAYVEPSVRPDDGRYGENPNRLQQHTQFQVILKPDPGNPQEIYLRSLQAMGIDVHKHDIRFVEDNWQSPALGAWGLGWEVWLDGLEITQFTYFQQAGGILLDPVSVEITYGLDRIAMAIQNVQNVGDVQWSKQRTWGELNLQSEREHSKYYFEVADIDRLRQMYELYELEAKSALEAGLMLPAYDYVLKSSHAFNILDARGAIGVTERQAYFRRMRALSGQVAEAYLADRQRQEFPWLSNVGTGLKPVRSIKLAGPKQATDFILEIGTEELPPSDLDSAIEQLQNSFAKLLDEEKLKHSAIKVMGTPRRLVVYIPKLAPKQADIDQVAKGPPAARAFATNGTPTPAAEGFARGQGVAVSALKVEEIDGGKYVVAHVHQKGRRAAEVLASRLPELLATLRFDESMRWNSSGVSFSRPVRWLLAIHGEYIVPFEFAGLQTGKASRSLRLSKADIFKVESAKDYLAKLKKQAIVLDPQARRKTIDAQVQKLAKQIDGHVPADEELRGEVTHLVEAPTALRGEFDKSFLELPREVLIAVMKTHQRYFPVEKNNKLLNSFIAVGNGDFDAKAVTAGNAAVLRARFADASYFIRKDRERPLKDYVQQLKQLTFQTKLGSMWDKTTRIVSLVSDLGARLGLDEAELRTAARAAELCKADLVTKMVIEMTALQGVMGKYYALDSGERPEVAEAIFEHYLPRAAGDAAPSAKPGLGVGIADRLDTLTGLFAIGLAPTGAKDPFAQRRAAIGLVQNLIAWKLDFDLREGIALAASKQPVAVSPEAQTAALDFIIGRLRALLIEQGERHDIVDAILAAQGHNPATAAAAVKDLSTHVGHKVWPQVLAAFSRCVRITRDLKEIYEVNETALTDQNDLDLLSAIKQAEGKKRQPGSVNDFFGAFAPLIPVITRYFDDVLVMSEDESLRRNRLGMLQRIVALADGVADFSKLESF